jgi:Na+/melibiose symporter-like transporter
MFLVFWVLLLFLVYTNVIPSDYWSFYENITEEYTKRDCLSESDVNEDD